MTDTNVIEIVYTALKKHDLAASETLLVVGVSGGTDSLALLHILVALNKRLRLRLHVATLDHGLRGEQSAADARFVAELARRWNLPVTTGYADVHSLAREQHTGIEAAARIARYNFLASVAREVGAERIAVAHNANDQVETVLLHLLRGSGLTGLSGMDAAAPLPGHPDLTLVRPLLDVPRADLEAYCREQNLAPRQDVSNDDIHYTRNRLRRETIPYLETLFPQIERRLLQLAEIAALEDDLVDSALHSALDAHITRSPDRTTLPRVIFKTLHPALQRRFVIEAAHRLTEVAAMSYVHVIAAVEVALNGQVGARALLGGGVQLRVDYDALIIERSSAALPDDLALLPAGAEIQVAIPGATSIQSGWSLRATLTLPANASLRLAIPEGSTVVLRGRHRGDRFAPLGLGGHTQKLAEWMTDHKLPRQLRDRVPLLVIDSQIAAICWRGWTVSHHFAVSSTTKRPVYFELNREF